MKTAVESSGGNSIEMACQAVKEVRVALQRGADVMVWGSWTALQESRDRYFERLYRLAVFVLKATLVTMTVFVFFGTLVLFASFVYWSFYMWYLPQLHHTVPAYFDFRDCVNGSASGPHATVNLLNTQWHYRHDLTLPPYDLSRLLTGGVAYDIELQVRYPDSMANREMGMMMCEVEMFHSSKSEIVFLASSTRSLLLWYQSFFVRWGRKFLLILPLISGLISEEESLTIPLLENFHEHPTYMASFLKLHLTAIKGCSLELVSAQLLFHAKLRGLRYIMYHWFLSSAVVGISTLVVWQLVFWAFVCVCLKRCYPWLFGGESTKAIQRSNNSEGNERETPGRNRLESRNSGISTAMAASAVATARSDLGRNVSSENERATSGATNVVVGDSGRSDTGSNSSTSSSISSSENDVGNQDSFQPPFTISRAESDEKKPRRRNKKQNVGSHNNPTA